MAKRPVAQQDAYRNHLRLAQTTVRNSVSVGRVKSKDSTWLVWEAYCEDMGADPLLSDRQDALPLLQVFAVRYRSGELAKNKGKNAVRSGSVEDALRAIGQTIASVGIPDPRLLPSGKLIPGLSNQIKTYKREDPASQRVKPVTILIIQTVLELAQKATGLTMYRERHISNLIVLGFFFLSRPGEYLPLASATRSKPFRLCDVKFFGGIQHYASTLASLNDLTTYADYVELVYNDQKNATKGQALGHGLSGDALLCPVRAIIRLVANLRAHNAHAHTPLYTFFDTNGNPSDIVTAEVTAALRRAAGEVYHITGIHPDDITARSLRAGGANALLCAGVDPDIVKMIGRWKSDAMMDYLIAQARPNLTDQARQMVQHGNFNLSRANTTTAPRRVPPVPQNHTVPALPSQPSTTLASRMFANADYTLLQNTDLPFHMAPLFQEHNFDLPQPLVEQKVGVI